MNNGNKGFTLIELLVVVVIILLIAGMMFPIFGKIRQAAQRAKAREMVSQLSTAWNMYFTDNRKFPDIDITQMDSIACSYINTNEIEKTTMFRMEFTKKEKQQGLKDYWGALYQVRLDSGRGGDSTAYDGQIEVPSSAGSVVVQKTVAIWSKGKLNGLNGTSDNPSDDIKSW